MLHCSIQFFMTIHCVSGYLYWWNYREFSCSSAARCSCYPLSLFSFDGTFTLWFSPSCFQQSLAGSCFYLTSSHKPTVFYLAGSKQKTGKVSNNLLNIVELLVVKQHFFFTFLSMKNTLEGFFGGLFVLNKNLINYKPYKNLIFV